MKKQKQEENPDKIYSKKKPLWVTKHLSLLLDIVKFVEVDFFTLSAFLIYEPFVLEDIYIYNETVLKPHIFNIYNWKYIT